MMAVILLFGAMPIIPFSFTSAAEEPKDEVLFSSSFESSDPAVTESQSDNGYYKGLERYEIVSAIPGDFTELVDLATLKGSNDFKSEEGKAKLFDASSSTKFLTETKPSANSPAWISFALTEARVVGLYAITSANDEAGRDPKAWKLYGSSDGKSYVEIDSRTGESFSSRYQTKQYSVENTVAYQYYKLEITENNGSSNMTQFADLYLASGKGAVEEAKGESPMQSVLSKGPASTYVASDSLEQLDEFSRSF